MGTGAGEPPAPVETKARKFPCSACGAAVVWSPGAAALRCPYCGAERTVPASAGEIVERPIEEALSAPHDLGWGTDRKTFQCSRCAARTTFEPGQSAGTCAFCGNPAVAEAPSDAQMVRPEGLLPFQVDRNAALGSFRSWISSLWLRPGDLKEKASVTGMKGVYVPFWTFDAATHSAWNADAGYYYTVAVEVEENGRTVVRQEQRVRWERASGFLELFFDDVPVPASRGLDRSLAASIEPFPTQGLLPYDPAYLSGFLAEEYAVGAREALGLAQERMSAEIEAACSRQVPGDTQRNLSVSTAWSGVAYKNALLPLWIAAYEYAGKPWRFLVNGVTGRIAGKAPYSPWKVGLLVLAIAAALFVLYQVGGR